MLTEYDRQVGLVVKDVAIGAGDRGFDCGADQIRPCRVSPMARHHCDVSVSSRRYAAEMDPDRYTHLCNTYSCKKTVFFALVFFFWPR